MLDQTKGPSSPAFCSHNAQPATSRKPTSRKSTIALFCLCFPATDLKKHTISGTGGSIYPSSSLAIGSPDLHEFFHPPFKAFQVDSDDHILQQQVPQINYTLCEKILYWDTGSMRTCVRRGYSTDGEGSSYFFCQKKLPERIARKLCLKVSGLYGFWFYGDPIPPATQNKLGIHAVEEKIHYTFLSFSTLLFCSFPLTMQC